MRFGYGFATGGITTDEIAEIAALVDDSAIASIWLPEHVVRFDSVDSAFPYAVPGQPRSRADVGALEPFGVLSYLAATTSRVRLGLGVSLLPQRNPVYTALLATTVDHLSGGRFDFGIGVGWCQEEFAAVQVPWGGRGARCREYVEV